MARVSRYQTASAPSEKGWRAGLYIRLSREDGDKMESESVLSQRAILERFLSEKPSIALGDYYIDDGWSGTDFDRPAFKRLMADVTAGKVNCVIVKDLSRFGRNYVEAGKYIETVFPLFNVRFIAINDGLDSEERASSNNLIVPIKNVINDEYCRDISMKVRSALDIRRRQGKFIGSFAPYGYQKDESDHNRLVIDEEAAGIVRRIFVRFLSGYSILSIARELNEEGLPNPSAYKAAKGLNCNRAGGLWCDATVRRILKNELYIGNLVQKKNQIVSHKIHRSKPVESGKQIRVQGTHKAIVSVADFERAQNLLGRDMRVSPKGQKLSLFAGFVKCADCGRAMQKRTVVQPYKKYDYYVCSTHKKCRSACGKHAIRSDFLEEAVLGVLNGYIARAVDIDDVLQRMNEEERKKSRTEELTLALHSKERERVRAQNILTDLYPDFKCGIIGKEQYFALKEKYEHTLDRLKTEITELKRKAQETNVCTRNEFIEAFKKYRGLKELTREVITELVENIFVHDGGEVELRLRFRDELAGAEKRLIQSFISAEENNSVVFPQEI